MRDLGLPRRCCAAPRNNGLVPVALAMTDIAGVADFQQMDGRLL